MTTPQSLITRLASPDATGRTEADIQSDIKTLLITADFDLDTPRLEEQIGDGSRRRIDIATGATVIEVKKRLTNETADADYINQLAGYVTTRMSQDGSRYNGILTDGKTWWLFEQSPADGSFARRSTFELAPGATGVGLIEWLQAVLATRSNITPTHANIESLLGASSPAYDQDVAYLLDLYAQVRTNPTVGLKRDLWARLLRSALGTGFDTDNDKLFIDHTLLVVEASVIGHAVMELPLDDLLQHPERLLSGDEFRQAGIYNVIESGFFDWILFAEGGEQYLSRIVKRIQMFDWSDIDHDVLKILYESVINADVRKGMGEYYTPDWLAEGVTAKVLDKPLEQSALDPACGSGTFVFQAIRRIITAAEAAGWDSPTIVEHVQNHVFGLDIHPVSVLLARVTYLLALGEHLQDRGDVWVPVHLGDSMQWYQPGDHEENVITINTEGVDLADVQNATLFSIARTLAFPLNSMGDTDTFDQLVTAMTDRAKEHTDPTTPRPEVKSVLKKFGITPGTKDYTLLAETFATLCDLNAEGRDSIWGFYIRNQVRPLWLSMPSRRVDVLIGNPPWVAYRYMTPDLQEKYRAFANRYNLWHGGKVATQQDLVGLFITRSVAKYLNDGGTFGFVTPLAVLSRKAYEGFRAGRWGTYLRGEFTETWDLDTMRPRGFFPVPSAVVFGTRHTFHDPTKISEEPACGFPPTKKVLSGLRVRNDWPATYEALTITEAKNVELGTDAGDRSPYNEVVVNGATIFPRMLFFVEEQTQTTSRLGRTQGTTTVESYRTKLEKEPWKSQPSWSATLPSRYVFDVHLGSTLVPFGLLEPWRAVLPIDRQQLMDEQQINNADNGVRDWWRDVSQRWEDNKTKQSRLSLMDNLDYQRKLSKQLNTVKHRVVYTASGNTIAAARLANPRALTEHALYWLPASGADEAKYLTAILNAPVTTELVAAYQSRGLFGGRHIDKNVWRLPIPKFDPADPLHTQLVDLAAKAEEVAAGVEAGNYGFQKHRQLVRNALAEAGITEPMNTAVKTLLGEDD
ncbi:N-6 DNA methylase [Corynebacterium tuberculostearicum]|uniref:N-6 DNA methylase n=1 Tax=Corynebacterium tuberculostearicum TaxID=38304 RepID=UPI00195C188D|nr:N-6 DNA methylase [Corynebacterium tuberculostearicum]QRQ67853.1 N-6 DNA methylase [Corynebacterium tuberculostearicum]